MSTDATISIDFWNTLVRAETGGKERKEVRIDALREVSGRYIDNLTGQEYEEAKKRASRHYDKIWFNQHRTPTTHELIKEILNYLGVEATGKEQDYLVEAFEESLWEGPPELAEDARKVIPRLAEQYSLALISDTMYSPGRVIRKFLKQNELLTCFRCFVFSDETGFSKPNPKAYYTVLEQTGAKAEASWHIGDLLRTDIAGAKSVGMNTILFTGFSRYSDAGEEEAEPDYICNSWEEVAGILM